MSETKRFFIFGAGYSGKAFARSRPEAGVELFGTTRSAENFEDLRQAGIKPLHFDGQTVSPELRAAIEESTHLVVSIAPDESGDPVLNAAAEILRGLKRLQWIGYLSTVGVYGDHGGAWVDETSECRPVSRRSKFRVAAEQAWSDFGRDSGLAVAILRLSGIYGPGRNAFVNLAAGTARRLVKPGQVFNRIHVDDIAGALWHLAGARTGGIFNVTDDRPAPPQDVVAYAAGVMGVDAPPEIPFETAELTPMARSFYGENKRVSNALIRQTGYVFRYPDYVSALDAMWADGSWRGAGASDARSPMRR